MIAASSIQRANATWYHNMGVNNGSENMVSVISGYSGGKAWNGCEVGCESTRWTRNEGKWRCCIFWASVFEELAFRNAHWLFALESRPSACNCACPCQNAMA